MFNIQLIKEYIKLLGMAVVYTVGSAISFWVVLPLLAYMLGELDFHEDSLY